MKTKLITGTLALAGILASVAACGAEGMDDEFTGDESALEKRGGNRNGSRSGSSSSGSSTTTTSTTTTTTSTTTAAVCTDPDGTNAVLAALAVAMGQELHRWQSSKDLYTDGWMVYLSNEGKSRCPNGNCVNTQALLDLQKDAAINQVQMPSGVYLYPPSLRSRLVAKYNEQKVCESRPDNHAGDNCPVEDHYLTFQYAAPGSCDTNFFFEAKKPNGSALQYPAQLKNKLLFADWTNAYVNFQHNGEIVSIDPTYGLNEGGATSSGSCSAACMKFSRTDIEGECCSCFGATRTYQRSFWSPVTYLCR